MTTKASRRTRCSEYRFWAKREDIPRLVDEYGVEEIIVAIPSAPGWVIRELVDICSTTPAKLKIVPGLYELIDGRVSVNQIRELQVEDLLDREPVKVDLDSMAGYLSGRTVLVTGAGGSIGSELCRQIARFKPRCLILLDHCENAIYEIHRELGEQNPECELVPVVADIRDKQAMDNLFAGLRPQVVFHAAAHKHVPLMEDNPAAALKNNVLGTWNVARAAHDGQIETFILISTDKAVNPVSIMGATKRVAEMVIQYLAQNSSTRFAAVRFGNVLGSSGSVVPPFSKADCPRWPGHGDPSGDDSLFHDHTGSGAAGYPSRRAGQRRRNFCTGHGQADEDCRACSPHDQAGRLSPGAGYSNCLYRYSPGGEALRGDPYPGGGSNGYLAPENFCGPARWGGLLRLGEAPWRPGIQ